MRKITLLVASLLLMSNATLAENKKVFSANDEGYRFLADYRTADPIVFRERGIEFLIFMDGQFDFNTNPSSIGTRNRVENTNRTFGAPGVRSVTVSNTYYGPALGVRVEHDSQGRVRRIGNVFINYDAFGRVKRIGSVYMKYNSFALKQVGNLKIIYNRRGQIMNIIGFVNFSNQDFQYDYSLGHENFDYQFQNNNSDDFYYYRTDGSKVKMSEEDIKEIKIVEESLRKK